MTIEKKPSLQKKRVPIRFLTRHGGPKTDPLDSAQRSNPGHWHLQITETTNTV